MAFMVSNRGSARAAALLAGLACCLAFASPARAQQTGSIAGRVTSATGAPLAGAQVVVEGTNLGVLVHPDGSYLIERVPPGTHTVVAQMLGYRPQSAQVTVAAGQRASQDFRLAEDALELAALVVTGTQAPRTNLDAPVAVTVLSPQELEKAAPRSTTEALRYVPGFTRVESSGGEVNQNISMRGILGVEYVMFMEDGLPVFPTMHTFFMNADNLFRPDENIERIEVVRGGTSALFGSNTPGAIVNFINHQGGPELRGTMKATVGTEELARYDLNLNGPLGENWRFNVGGFYRFDNGVRDPGFPGIRGGQFKASLTRLLDQGQVRASLKIIDDRNQFILPLPFHDPDDPEYVTGFSDYGSMSTAEGLGLSVPTPDGRLELPLDDGLRTKAYWLTGDARFVLPDGWSLQNSIQVMENQQGWNAIVPSDVRPVQDWLDDVLPAMGFPAGSQGELFFTNYRDANGDPLPFDTDNGLVAPAGLWHVEKPLAAFQNQFQLRKEIGQHSLALGLYFGHYTQTNRWYFTDILMDVRDQPRFLDLVVVPPAGTPVEVTRGGFRRFISNYTNGEGHTTILSGMLGGSFQLSERLRADAGLRYERDEFVLSAENTTNTDLDGDAGTPYDNVVWGAGTFRHIRRTLDDVAASLAVNYRLSDEVSLYGLATRAYKMPALDEFLNTDGQEDADSFDVSSVRSIEAGVKYASGSYSLTVNGFLTELRNVLSQGVETDPVTGAPNWVTRESPETRSFGAELEFTAQPNEALTLVANATVLEAEFAECPEGCPAGADLGTVLNGVPPVIGNLSATYTLPTGVGLLADFHYVHRRFSDYEAADGTRNKLPTYHYLNLGATYPTGVPGLSLSATLQNVYQSKGLEEGNPRLTSVGGRTSDFFLARPILPRRLVVSLSYEF